MATATTPEAAMSSEPSRAAVTRITAVQLESMLRLTQAIMGSLRSGAEAEGDARAARPAYAGFDSPCPAQQLSLLAARRGLPALRFAKLMHR